MQQAKFRENIIYLSLWLMLFLAPVISMYVKTQIGNDAPFFWREIFDVWKAFAIYLGIFLVHNFLIAPILVNHQKKMLYFGIVISFVILFLGGQLISQPHRDRNFHDQQMRQSLSMTPHGKKARPEPVEWKRPMPPQNSRGKRPPFMYPGEPEIIATLLVILMFGMNLAVKLYFHAEQREKHLMMLEKQNLNTQLEYLKYQINPHFFMNTLNNIHALINIEPARAQSAIVWLSGMMRYILHEGSKQFVPIKIEHAFLSNYIQLMRLRFDPSKVDIKVNAPDMADCNMKIPPLLTINFIENAFKHGISYQQQSFIHINSHLEEGRFIFECHNSKHPESTEEHGGIGLANTRKRLDLLFDKDYELQVINEDNIYGVYLNIPLTC